MNAEQPQEGQVLTPEQREIQEARTKASEAFQLAQTTKITTQEEYALVGAKFAEIRVARKTLEARRVAITGPINTSLRRINEEFKQVDLTLADAQDAYEKPMKAFVIEQDRIRKEAERVAEEARKAKEVEDERIRKEEADKVEEDRKAAVLANSEAQRVAESPDVDPMEAALAEDAAQVANFQLGQATVQATQVVKAIESTPVRLAPIPAAPRAAGTKTLRPWCYKIIDASLLPREFLIPNESMLGMVAKTQKGNARVPGVEFYEDVKIGG